MTLVKAAFIGNLELVRQLVEEGEDIEKWNDNGQTPLHNAIENMNHDVIEFLLDAGANMERDTRGGWSPLIHALDIETDAAHQIQLPEPYSKILSTRIARGADVNRRCGWGYTPLEFARRLHNRVAERILIDAGAQ